MEMFLTGHEPCCSLAVHNLEGLGQSVADAVPLSHPDFPALFPLLPFLAQVEIEPIMWWRQSGQRCCPQPRLSSGTLPSFSVP